MKEFLPHPSNLNNEEVDVEYSTEANNIEGGGEAMAMAAALDEQENLV